MYKKIEISINEICNSKCFFCPRDLIYQRKDSINISNLDEIIYRIKKGIEQKLIIKNVHFVIGLFGEPFLDKNLFFKINLIKRRIKKSFITIYTNAILLSDNLELFKENKDICNLVISNYGDNIKDFNEITRIGINEEKFKSMKKAINEIKNYKNVRIWNARRDGKIIDVSTRAGLVKKVNIKNKVNDCGWDRLNDLYILSNGDMVLCCQDWKRETLYGNILNDSLSDILQNNIYNDIIKKVKGAKSDLLFICKRCRYSK